MKACMWSGSMALFLLKHQMEIEVSITLLQIRFVGLQSCSLGSILTEPSWLLRNCSPLTCTLNVMCDRVFINCHLNFCCHRLLLAAVALIVLISVKPSTKFIRTCRTCINTKQQRYSFGPVSNICRKM